jgi:hypothetical protein
MFMGFAFAFGFHSSTIPLFSRNFAAKATHTPHANLSRVLHAGAMLWSSRALEINTS